MATNQELPIEILAQIAMVAANAAVQKIVKERRDEDEITRCRGNTRGMRSRLDGHSPVYTYTDKVTSVLHTQKISKAKNSLVDKIIQDKQTIIQAEHEDHETVKSLQFCKLKRCKSEKVEEWIKWLRIAAEECKYQELDRQVKEQSICGINDEYMQIKIDSELKVISKTDEIMSD